LYHPNTKQNTRSIVNTGIPITIGSMIASTTALSSSLLLPDDDDDPPSFPLLKGAA